MEREKYEVIKSQIRSISNTIEDMKCLDADTLIKEIPDEYGTRAFVKLQIAEGLIEQAYADVDPTMID